MEDGSDEEEIVSELEESLEDDDEDENRDYFGDGGGGKGKEGKQLGSQERKVVDNNNNQTKRGDGSAVQRQTLQIPSQKSSEIYPLSPYKDHLDVIGEQDEEYSTSFYPANESTQLNQSMVSFKSKLSTRSSKIKNKSSKDEDDHYSSSFEEETSDIHDAYSGDFENEFSFSTSKNKVETPKKKNSVRIQSKPLTRDDQKRTSSSTQPQPQSQPALPMLPSIEIQTLQAEMSLQMLSKEVIHLRNQQRESLRARRAEVLEKKKRAQARREEYLREMNELQSKLHEVLDLNRNLEETIQVNDRKLTIVEKNNELLSQQNQELNEIIVNLQNEITESRRVNKELQETIHENEERRINEKEKWAVEKENLRKEKVSCELQIEILTKSNEKNEQRIAIERESLPSHHQTILQERVNYLQYLEESLLQREESLKIEQQRNNFFLETMKHEIRSDWEKREVSLRLELEQEREMLQKEQLLKQHELEQLEFQLTSQKTQLEVMSHELRRKESDLKEKEKIIEKDLIKTEIVKEGMKPINELYQTEKERLYEMREQLQRCENDLLSRQAHLSRHENEIKKREMEVERLLYIEIADERENLREKERRQGEYQRAIQRNFEILEKEKNKIYQCSLEMKRQYEIIQFGYRKWKKAIRFMKIGENSLVGRERRQRSYPLFGGGDGDEGELQIREIEEDINWNDIVNEIRDEIKLLDMGPEENSFHYSNRDLRRQNQDIEEVEAEQEEEEDEDEEEGGERGRHGYASQRKLLLKHEPQQSQQPQRRQLQQQQHISSEGKGDQTFERSLGWKRSSVSRGDDQEVLSLDRGMDDSLEYSLVSTSPGGNQRNPETKLGKDLERSRFSIHEGGNKGGDIGDSYSTNRRGQQHIGISYPPPLHPPPLHPSHTGPPSHFLSSSMGDEIERKEFEWKNNLTATIDLQITADQMKNIAMKYHAV